LSNYSYATCAISGKAAQRIEESTGLRSSTIHRLLGYNPAQGWTYDNNNPLEEDIVALDEGSFLDSYLAHKLIRAIKPGSKLIIIGDTGQLTAIGAGSVLEDLINSKVVPVISLTQVHRQAEKSGILSIANKVREGKQIISKEDYKTHVFGELQDLYVMPYSQKESVYNKLIAICSQYKEDILDFQVIVPMKTRGVLCVNNLNKELQEIFNNNYKNKIYYGKKEFRSRDKVIQKGNNYEKGIFNGTIGVIDYIDEKNKVVAIKFTGHNDSIYFNYDELEDIQLAYAITGHSYQGSQSKYTVIALDYSAFLLLSRQWIYTALSRAEKSCILICELDALRYAIQNNQQNKRNTFLPIMLNNCMVKKFDNVSKM